MTRHEALHKFDCFGKTFTLDEARQDIEILISKIYDDFESRTCENCKYFELWDRDKGSGKCTLELSIAYTMREALYDNDGCNKFEIKEQTNGKLKPNNRQ